MALGGYLSVRTEREILIHRIATERYEIEHEPDEERQVGLSFVLGGLIPTVPILLSLPQTRWWSYGLTAVTAFGLGSLKARYTQRGPLLAGLEFLLLVTLGTLTGIGLGLFLHVQ